MTMHEHKMIHALMCLDMNGCLGSLERKISPHGSVLDKRASPNEVYIPPKLVRVMVEESR